MGEVFPPNENLKFGQSVAYSYMGHVTGIPGYESPQDNQDRGGVLLENFPYLGDNLCQAGINLSLVNFTKPAGNYSDVIANKIDLGGRSLPATIENGAIINYQANEITLHDGFVAEEGSNFTAVSDFCTAPGDSPANQYNSQDESDISDQLKKELFRYYVRIMPDFPWRNFNLYNNIDFGDLTVIQSQSEGSTDNQNKGIEHFSTLFNHINSGQLITVNTDSKYKIILQPKLPKTE